MYDSVMLTLIFFTLLWIAVGLQVVASSIRTLGKVFTRPTRKTVALLERNNMPFIIKMVVVKVIGQVAIRYVTKKLR